MHTTSLVYTYSTLACILGCEEGADHRPGCPRQRETQMEQIVRFIAEAKDLPNCITRFRIDYWGFLVGKVTVHWKGPIHLPFPPEWGLRFENTTAQPGQIPG